MAAASQPDATLARRAGDHDDQAPARTVLVAGVGNILRGDDGFGVALVRELETRRADLPAGISLVEIGIGGIGLVLALQDGYDALLIADAVDRGGAPGSLYLLEPEVPDLAQWPFEQRHDFLADMHMTTPARALVLARALGVLPPRVYLLGCQPTTCDDLVIGLSPPVADALAAAVERAIAELGRLAATGQRAASTSAPHAGREAVASD